MSLSGANAGYLDVRNAILRVGTLDVQTIVSGVDTATNIAKTNTILLWDDQGSDMNSPPFILTSATRSTSPPYLELGGGVAHVGIKLPNAWLGAFEVYMSDTTDASIKLHTYTTDTTTYGDTGYELVLDNSGVTLNYDGAQVATGSCTWTNDTWHQVVVGFERGAWTVSVDGTPTLIKDDIEREAVYANVGQYLRIDAASATTTKRVRYVKFAANGQWLQSNTGALSYTQGNVGIGVTNPARTFHVRGQQTVWRLDRDRNSAALHLHRFPTGDWTAPWKGYALGVDASDVDTGEFFIGDYGTAVSGGQTRRLTIDDSGNVIIGTHTTGSHLLEVAGTAAVSSNLEVGTANLFVDTTTSNVGVGTDAPAYKLDVLGSANVGTLNATLTYSNASANIVAWNTSTNEVIDSGLERGFTEHPVETFTGSTTYNANIGTSGEFPPSTHYIEGHGTYEAWASTQYNVSGQATREVWKLFDGSTSTYFQQSSSTDYDKYNVSSPYEYVGTRGTTTTDVGGTRYMGVWVQLKLPYTITLAYTKINNWTSNTDRSPGAGVILGSNDGDNWYKLTEFSGLTYTSNEEIVQVNATTPYQYYRMVATNTVGSGSINFTEWRLFAEKPVTRMENVHISGELSSETLQTGYIKWPKVPLKANESEGYVVTASSEYGSTYQAFYAFDDQSTIAGVGTAYAWVTPQYTFNNTTGDADSANCANFDNLSCEWIQLQSPNPFAVSYFDFDRRETTAYNSIVEQETPREGYLYASNDGVTWTRLTYFSNLPKLGPHDWERVNVGSNEAYMYYRLVVTKVHPNGTGAYLGISNLRFFEAATGVGAAPTSAKLQVAGSLGMAKGSEFFAGDDVVMELPKHDRPLTKYPEVAMTADSSGGYTASASSIYSSYVPFKAFNEITTIDESLDLYITDTGTYDTTDGTQTGSASLAGVPGEYLKLQLPTKINIRKVRMYTRKSPTSGNPPTKARIFGSNDDTFWTQLGVYENDATPYDGSSVDILIDAHTGYYKYFALLIEEVKILSALNSYACIAELEYYGYEEGDTSVDVVHRSIPNTPSPQHLEVYWDAADSNSYSFADSSNVYDLSGSAVKGTITGTNGFDAEYNAWVFDGSGDYISGTQGIGTGQPVHSQSVWFKQTALGTNYSYVCYIGTSVNSQQSGIVISESTRKLWFDMYGSATSLRSQQEIQLDRWYHVVVVYTGGNWNNTNCKMYINGVEEMLDNSTSTTTALNLTGTNVVLNRDPGTTWTFTGSMANYRLFGKALNADQIRELYEYDAPRFGHRQNLVALHKGRLGVGVAHPTSRFEIAGADGLQEFPPKAMTDFETYMEGHGVFRASASTFASSSYQTHYAFDYNTSTAWLSGPGYDGTDGSYGGSVVTGNVDGSGTLTGEWIQIELPHKTFISRSTWLPNTITRGPKTGSIIDSNDGSTWYTITSFSGKTYASSVETELLNVTASTAYKYFRIVGTTIDSGARLEGKSWRLFGTPAPSSLEDGHLTLGKALTLPRVSGHPAGAETPRAASLVVHYDTTVDSVVSGSTVVDISGSGNNGTLTGGGTYESLDRAFKFDGNVERITANPTLGTGDQTFSVSFWAKRTGTAYNGTVHGVVYVGTNDAAGYGIGMDLYDNSAMYWFVHNGKYLRWNNSSVSGGAYTTFPLNEWVHVVCTHESGTWTASNNKVYINGVHKSDPTVGGSTELNFQTSNPELRIGDARNNPFTGQISNFKLWDVALTPEEVAAEYALGRTGKSINLTDTSLCLGGTVPRAQLDVRGSALIGGNVGIGYYGSTDKEALAPLDVRGNYIQNLASGTVSTAARFGSSDGTLHVSSIKTSNGAETLALQTTIDNKTMDYNIENGWTYGTDTRHALCLQPYKGLVGIGTTNPGTALEIYGEGKDFTFKYDTGLTRQSAANRDSYYSAKENSIKRVGDRNLLDNSPFTPDTTHEILFGFSDTYTQWQTNDEYYPSYNEIRFKLWTPTNSTTGSLNDIMTLRSDGNVGIGTTSPGYKLDVNGLASSKTSRVFEFSGSDNYARHFWICSFLDAPGYHTNQLIKINYSVTYKRLTDFHSRNSLASGTVTFSDLWRYTTSATSGEFQYVTLQDQKNEQYGGQGALPKWYYVRFNNIGYLVLSVSVK